MRVNKGIVFNIKGTEKNTFIDIFFSSNVQFIFYRYAEVKTIFAENFMDFVEMYKKFFCFFF